jgi:hypothetical protein
VGLWRRMRVHLRWLLWRWTWVHLRWLLQRPQPTHRRPPRPLGLCSSGGTSQGEEGRSSRPGLCALIRRGGRRPSHAALNGGSGAQLVLHAVQSRRTSSADALTASHLRTLQLSAARRPVVSAAVPRATVPTCALWRTAVGTVGTFFLVRLLPMPWCGDRYLQPPTKLRVLPPRNGLIRWV